MTKKQILEGFEEALQELKMYREGKLELHSVDESLETVFKGDWAEGKTAVEYANELRSSRTFTRTVDIKNS